MIFKNSEQGIKSIITLANESIRRHNLLVDRLSFSQKKNDFDGIEYCWNEIKLKRIRICAFRDALNVFGVVVNVDPNDDECIKLISL